MDKQAEIKLKIQLQDQNGDVGEFDQVTMSAEVRF